MDGLDVAIAADSQRRSSYSHRPTRPAPRRRLRRHLPFFLVVILPTLVTAYYLYGMATDQYVSEARFVVRGPSQQAPGMLSGLLESAGVSRAQDDTYAVQDFMLSRDALAELVRQDDLKAIFARPEADGLSRFPMDLGVPGYPGWRWQGRDTFEHLFRYYLKHVDVEVDSTTGVSQLTVTSFRPDDSRRIAAALLAAGEALVNRMNEREHENALRDARKEVKLAEQRVQDVSSRLADFRNRESLLDPNKQSVPMLAAIASLQARLSSVKLELSQLQPNSPLLASTRQRAAALQAQIDSAKSEITGTDSSLVPKIREFDQLTLERDFADKQLSSATTSLEAARIAADRQQLYLEEVVKPNEPDYADFPRRLRALAIVFASCFGLYTAGALIMAGAREHKLV